MIIGITGGMGCGKSRVGAILQECGFRLIDSDVVIREHVLVAPEMLASIRQKFGDEVFSLNGELDRSLLAVRVFANDMHRLWLEALLHPPLLKLWRKMLTSAPRSTPWAVEVPLLFEKNLESWFDLTICVAASTPQQIARLEQRGIPKPLAEQRIAKQLPLTEKIDRADLVLWNDGSVDSLKRQIDLTLVKAVMKGSD